MFTLQILDRGQTFYQPLEGRALLLGSADTADLRLQEHGVAAEHLRIEPAAGDGAPVLIALGDAPVTINGRPVQRATLALGDRIELGRAVLVVGRSVQRPARPEDVLGDGLAATRARPRARRRSGGKLLAIGVAVLATVGVVLVASGGGDGRLDTHGLERLRRQGEFAQARHEIDRLRAAWARDDQDRQRQLDGETALIEAVEQGTASLRQEILGSDAGNAEWNLRLQELETSGYEPSVRESARIVRSSLTDLLQQRPRTAAPARPPVAAAQPAQPATPTAAETAAPGTAASETATPAGLGSALQDAARLQSQGLFSQAIDTLQAALAGVAAADAAPLRTALAQAQAAADAGLQQLLQQARELAAGDKTAAAIELLAQNAHRFSGNQEFAALPRLQEQLQQRQQASQQKPLLARAPAAAGAPDVNAEARSRATLESLRARLDQVRTAEAAGDFVGSEQLLREGADAVAMRDPAYAERMRQRADEFSLLGELHRAALIALQAGRSFEVTLRSGIAGRLVRIEDSKLYVATADGELQMTWLDLSGASLQRIVADGKLPTRAWLGAAVLDYRNGEGAEAEALLAKALRGDARAKPDIDLVLARGRGEDFDPRGYALEKDGFVAVRTIEARKTAQKLAQRLEGLLRGRDQGARDAFVTDLLAQGPEAMESIVLLFRQELRKQIDQLAAGSLKKQVDKLSAQRELLDGARRDALSLIYDEAKYFYPYKPPAVSPERAAEYARVQAEVDRRVAALRTLWDDDRIKIKVPASLQQQLDRLDWVAKVLSDLGELDAAALAEIEWARALPPGDQIDARNFCRTPSERDELLQWQRIEEFNVKATAHVPSATREQLAITNDYRRMFRHRPLALNLKLVEAATGHATEMSGLGYFSHFSKTPGRHTPFERMQLAGYSQGVSENIALCDGAQGAHNAWLRSSGHHRNLLNPSHTEIGVAGIGRYWVQNFGHGTEYLADPLFAQKPR